MTWSPGQPLKTLEKPPFTAEQLRDYGQASRDHNPIHLDADFARSAGFPSVIVHGMLSMAFLGDLIQANFPRTEYRLKRMSTRFRKVTFPGDRLRCEGVVKSVEASEIITVNILTRNQNGDVTAEGEAELQPL